MTNPAMDMLDILLVQVKESTDTPVMEFNHFSISLTCYPPSLFAGLAILKVMEDNK